MTPHTISMHSTAEVSTVNKVLGYVTIAAIATYLVWRLFFTLPVSYGALAVVLGLLLYCCEFISGIQAIINYFGQIKPLVPERPDIPDSWYPDVDILIATHDEEVNLIYNTVNACLYLDYPDKSKVHIHLCDDMDRPQMRKLAKDMGINYISMSEPIHAKAGNMNNALKHTRSPLIAFLDADMIPRRELLTTLVPYFFLPFVKKNEQGQWVKRTPEEIDLNFEIGFVQTPQNFYNPDLFQYNLYAEERIPNEQIYFFREVNVSRNRANSTHMCGSNMMISRKALEEVGGFAINNITEDHETGINIQTAGYTSFALPVCLANGLNPPAVVNLIIQRERWGRGCMQTFHNMKIFTDWRIPLRRKLNYLCTALYWMTFFCRFVYIITPILVALFGVYVVECSLGELLTFWLPYYLLHILAMSRLSSKATTVNWNNTIDTIMFPFLVVPIMLDMLGIRLKRFKVTDKSHQSRTNNNPLLTLPHIILFTLSLVGIGMSLASIIQYRAFYNIIILFWLVVNAKSLLLAVFFMLGRTNDRYSYRIGGEARLEIEHNGVVYNGVTRDLSEGGLSAGLEFPVHLSPNELVTLRLHDRIYTAEMQCKLVQIGRTKRDEWLYSFRLEQIADDQLSQYRQMIYERDPSLPETVNETIPVLEDLKVNFDNRLGKHMQRLSRMLPRISETLEATLEGGTPVSLTDFNYHYVKASSISELAPGETVTVNIRQGVSMVLEAPEPELAAQNRGLFRVVNWRDWVVKPQYLAVIALWARVETPYAVLQDLARTGKVDALAPFSNSGTKLIHPVSGRSSTPKEVSLPRQVSA